MELRDGSTTLDTRLDRLIQFDERSRSYSIREQIRQAKKPRSFSWRCNLWLDQGSMGRCVSMGIGHELAARPQEVQGLTLDYLTEKIYWEAQKLDPWEGGAYPGARPKYEGTSVLAGLHAAYNEGWFASYHWSFSLNELILGVGYSGPAILGLSWKEGMSDPDKAGFIHATGDTLGGHCIMCQGVDTRLKFFVLHNSWGKSWGQDGRARISFADMEKLLDDNGEAAFLLGRRKTPIKPPMFH